MGETKRGKTKGEGEGRKGNWFLLPCVVDNTTLALALVLHHRPSRNHIYPAVRAYPNPSSCTLPAKKQSPQTRSPAKFTLGRFTLPGYFTSLVITSVPTLGIHPSIHSSPRGRRPGNSGGHHPRAPSHTARQLSVIYRLVDASAIDHIHHHVRSTTSAWRIPSAPSTTHPATASIAATKSFQYAPGPGLRATANPPCSRLSRPVVRRG